ncbi:MAG: DUF1343 domain-containing protein [Nitrospira bacterium HGW-Nitrospira-1]|nr:MAG: DUF1343 domain-containing protein [Nitrospira bacterium HGW-Nitrospira-1]
MSSKVKTGLDRAEKFWPKPLKKASIGLLAHPASINTGYVHSSEIFLKTKKCKLSALFGPQHGIKGETQDNMMEWEGFHDPAAGLSVYSLYGRTRKPLPAMLKNIDAMVIDMQDAGARYYTFIWTMALVMEASQEQNKAVVILDRPNPIGGDMTEGPVLQSEYASFVGLRSLPVRHGMTIAEIALYLKEVYYPALDLYIINMEGWKRQMWFDNTGLPWVLPSPNMPTLETAAVYPGMCLLEATNLSEGRGTTRPFEIFGAPFIEPDILVKRLREFRLPGVVFRSLHFLPAFQKHAGKLCGGAQIHVTERKKFKPFKTAAAILKSVRELYPKDFSWNKPPYEYEEKLLPIDVLAGTDRFRKDMEAGKDINAMEAWWNKELSEFNRKIRKKYLIYS